MDQGESKIFCYISKSHGAFIYSFKVVVCFLFSDSTSFFYYYKPSTLLRVEGIEVNKMDLVLLNIKF